MPSKLSGVIPGNLYKCKKDELKEMCNEAGIDHRKKTKTQLVSELVSHIAKLSEQIQNNENILDLDNVKTKGEFPKDSPQISHDTPIISSEENTEETPSSEPKPEIPHNTSREGNTGGISATTPPITPGKCDIPYFFDRQKEREKIKKQKSIAGHGPSTPAPILKKRRYGGNMYPGYRFRSRVKYPHHKPTKRHITTRKTIELQPKKRNRVTFSDPIAKVREIPAIETSTATAIQKHVHKQKILSLKKDLQRQLANVNPSAKKERKQIRIGKPGNNRVSHSRSVNRGVIAKKPHKKHINAGHFVEKKKNPVVQVRTVPRHHIRKHTSKKVQSTYQAREMRARKALQELHAKYPQIINLDP